MEKKETQRKLTLCDWCVLGGILTLIVSIAQPAFTQAHEEQKLTDLADHLQTVRSHIRLYKAEHGLYPGQERSDDLSVTAEAFIEAFADWDSEANRLGQSFPANPYVADATLGGAVVCVCDPAARPSGTEPAGWWYNAATGAFYACDSAFHTHY